MYFCTNLVGTLTPEGAGDRDRVRLPAETLAAKLASLPEGVSVSRDRIEVRFSGAKEAVERLYALAYALVNDYERFEGLVDGGAGGGGEVSEHIDTGTLAGLRDRALFSVMLYSFARVSAVLGMRRQDYFQQGSRGWLRLHEKGGKRHDVPAHHRAAAALDAYIEACGIEDNREVLFQSVDRTGKKLTRRALTRRVVLAMIKRRAASAGLPPSTCCHTFRATGITAYLSNGGTLEHAQQIAGHASPKTKLYDHTADTVTVDEIERILI